MTKKISQHIKKHCSYKCSQDKMWNKTFYLNEIE